MIEIDKTYIILNEKYNGRKPKYGLIKDGKKYIFKYGHMNNEIYAELIAEQLGKQLKINMAHYMYAKHNGEYGVLTDNFIQNNELIISSDDLRENASRIYRGNQLQFDKDDISITGIVQAAYALDMNIKTDKLINELMKRWVFYGLILESDKNETNISFLNSPKGLKLSPDYDNSSMCQLHKNIDTLVNQLKYSNIYSITDEVGQQVHLSKDTIASSFLDEYRIFCEKYPLQCINILELIKNVDVDKAIKIVEKNNEIEIPYLIKFWINKVIETRKSDLNIIYNSSKNKILYKK